MNNYHWIVFLAFFFFYEAQATVQTSEFQLASPAEVPVVINEGKYKPLKDTTNSSSTQYNLTITNQSTKTFYGPLYLVIQDLSPSTAFVINGDDQTGDRKAAFLINDSGLSPQQVVILSLQFAGGQNQITFNTAVYYKNTEPRLNPIANKTVQVGDTLNFLVSAQDDERDDLTFSFEPTLANASLDSLTGAFSFTPAAQLGIHTLTARVSDGLLEDSQSFDIEVLPSSEPPSEPSTISLRSFDFIEVRGREGHQGPFKIEGDPVIGSAIAMASVDGDIATITFDFVGEGDGVIASYSLQPPDEDYAFLNRYLGDVEVPSVPFGIVARGTLLDGSEFEGRFERSFTPKDIQMRFDPATALVEPGEVVNVNLEIINKGPTAEFEIVIVDTTRGLTPSLIQNIMIQEGQMSTVPFVISAPSWNGPDFKVYKVITSVATIDDPSRTTNAAFSMHVEVAP